MWELTYAENAEIKNVGAYIIPWGLFGNPDAEPKIVKYESPAILSGDTFSADLLDIPEIIGEHNVFNEMSFTAYPFVNDKLMSDELSITSTVNGANIDAVR